MNFASVQKRNKEGVLGGSVVKTVLPRQGVQVQSQVGE